MKIVISPAKSLDWESEFPEVETSAPVFLEKAQKVNAALKRKSRKKLMEMQSISAALAELNYHRNQEWTTNEDQSLCRPAVFAFNGDVYTGLQATTLNQTGLDNLPAQLRILSGLYGILNPLDHILPYRLEMGTSLKIGRKKQLVSILVGGRDASFE